MFRLRMQAVLTAQKRNRSRQAPPNQFAHK
jgi:hypothetical protein